MTDPDSKIQSPARLAAATTFLALLACSLPIAVPEASPTPLAQPEQATATPDIIGTDTASTASEATDEDASDVPPGWLKFEDDQFGLSFIYPDGWNGPEVHRWETGVTVEVGTDTVYPFGTGLDERNYTVTDAYFVSIQYTENAEGREWQQFIENQAWTEGYAELLDIEDGESISTPRSLTIRLREVEVGEFKGLMYISTLSETAQTMIFYAREALLFDENLNSIRITGSPNNVEIPEGEDWRTAYERVDSEHEQAFLQILESVSSGGTE